jgi:hypothetical protein
MTDFVLTEAGVRAYNDNAVALMCRMLLSGFAPDLRFSQRVRVHITAAHLYAFDSRPIAPEAAAERLLSDFEEQGMATRDCEARDEVRNVITGHFRSRLLRTDMKTAIADAQSQDYEYRY